MRCCYPALHDRQVRTSNHDQNDHSSQIDWNTEAGVVQNAALAFFVCAGRAAHCPQPPRHYGSQFPTLRRVAAPIHRLDCATEDMPRRTTTRRSFSGMPAEQRVSRPSKGFLRRLRTVVCGLAVIMTLHE